MCRNLCAVLSSTGAAAVEVFFSAAEFDIQTVVTCCYGRAGAMGCFEESELDPADAKLECLPRHAGVRAKVARAPGVG